MARTSTMHNKPKRVLLYGASGSGKTYLAGTFPSPVFIDLDDGMTTLMASDIEYYTVDTKPTLDKDAITILGAKSAAKDNGYLKTIALLEHFLNTLDSSSTLVLDSLSIFTDYALEHTLSLANQKTPRIQDWGAAQKLIESTISAFRDAKCHIVVIAHEEFTKDEESGVISWLPMTIGKLRSKLPLYFDEVYHNYAERGKGTNKGEMIYGIETSPTRRTTAKSRCNLVGNIEFPKFSTLYKQEK